MHMKTVLQILKEPNKKPQSNSYMWLYRTSGDTDAPIVLYEYQPDIDGKHPKEFLKALRAICIQMDMQYIIVIQKIS